MKKLISLALVAIMVLTMCVPAFATEGVAEFTVACTETNSEVNSNNQATVNVNLSNNPGIQTFAMAIIYPTCLTVDEDANIVIGPAPYFYEFISEYDVTQPRPDLELDYIVKDYDLINGEGAFERDFGVLGEDVQLHLISKSGVLQDSTTNGIVETITFNFNEDVYRNSKYADTAELPITLLGDLDYAWCQNLNEDAVEATTGSCTVKVPVRYKANIEIAGDIGLNTRIENIPDTDLDDYSAKAYIDGDETGSDLALVKDGGNDLVASLHFPAAEMTTPVKIEIYKDATLEKTFNTSVKAMGESYINLYKDNPETSLYATVAAAMLTYGSKAQQYFNVRTDDLADSNTALLSDYDVLFATTYPDPEAKSTVTDNNNGAKILGASMVLLENLDIKVYIETKNAISGYTATIDGKPAEIVHSNDNFYYVRVSDCTPETFKPTQENENGTVTVAFTNTSTSVVSTYEFNLPGYCVGCMNSGDAKLEAVGLSLFRYVLFSLYLAY